MTTIFKNAGLIGLGLIGGSLARAMKKHNVAENIAGYTNSTASSQRALELDIVDSIANSISEMASICDIIIISTPLSTYENITIEIARNINENCIITDVGSLKMPAINVFNKILPDNIQHNIVPAHPIAGTEKTGVESGFAELFVDKKIILTPTTGTSVNAINLVKRLWQICGGNVEFVDATNHDKIYAEVSHLPQFLAYCYASLLDKHAGNLKITDNNFWKFSRICASDPVIWLDIFILNKENLLTSLNAFTNAMKTTAYKNTSQDINCYLTEILPATISTSLIKCSANQQFAGSGFKDFTSYGMQEITENNPDLLNKFLQEISKLASTITQNNQEKMFDFMKSASTFFNAFKMKNK